MNLRTLRYFVAIADAGSLTAAAAAISIAQPALTRQLRELEADLGVPLFHRMPRGVRLTQAGVTLYEAAQRILGEAQRVRQRLASQASDTQTTVVLGVSPTLARVLLPGLFETCMRTLQDVQLRSREAFTPELLDWLERGIIDMAVVTNPGIGRSVSLQPLLGEPFALVSHVSMGMGPVVSLAQLAKIPLLMTSLHRDIVERQLLPLGKTLNVQAVLEQSGQQHTRQRGRDAQHHGGPGVAGLAGQALAHALGLTQDALGRLVKRDTCLGESHAAWHAMEERGAEVGLEFAQLPGQGRLRDRDGRGRGRQAAGIGDGHEVTQGPEVHDGGVSGYRYRNDMAWPKFSIGRCRSLFLHCGSSDSDPAYR